MRLRFPATMALATVQPALAADPRLPSPDTLDTVPLGDVAGSERLPITASPWRAHAEDEPQARLITRARADFAPNDIPVAAAAWLSGRLSRILFSILVALTWLAADYLAGRFPGDRIAYAWNFTSRLTALLIIALLVAMLRRSLLRERELSRTDSLTGAMNARAFREFAEAEIRRTRRYQHPITLVYVDIDGFKKVNDSLGHGAGNRLLCAIVDALSSSLRTPDVVARLGGDEFAILLPETAPPGARSTIDKVRAGLVQAAARGKMAGLIQYWCRDLH